MRGLTHREHAERHEVELRDAVLDLHPAAHRPDGNVIVVDCGARGSSERCGVQRKEQRRTQLAEVLDIGLDDVRVELLAVFYGEEDRVELADGACCGRERGVERRGRGTDRGCSG